MEKTQHTPGPWKPGKTIESQEEGKELEYNVLNESLSMIVIVKGPNAKQNAEFIAAAPETAEKCDRILRAMIEVANRLAAIREEWEMSDEVSASIVSEIDALNAAIDREEVWEPELIKAAKLLIDSGTHSEYTRGICELIADLFGRPGTFHADRAVEIAQEIGLDIYEAKKMYRTIPNGDTAPAQTVNAELLEALKELKTDYQFAGKQTGTDVKNSPLWQKVTAAIARAGGKEVSNG